MHIVALGGNGFIGSHFVAAAVDRGHEVTVMDLSPTPRFNHHRPFRFIQGATRDLAGMAELLAEADVLCHFAYSTVPATSNADPQRDVTDNLLPLLALLGGMAAAGLSRIVYLSSGGAVYGLPRRLPIDEDHPLRPVSSYGVTKVAAESYLGMFAANASLRPTIIRPANPYGAHQGKVGLLGAVTTFMNLIQDNRTATIWGDGSIVRDYVYIDDLTALLLLAVERDQPGIYNCGAGRGHSLNELITIIENATGRTLSREYRAARSFDPPKVVLDISRAKAAFGWSPRVGLGCGIERLAKQMGLARAANL